MSKENIEVVESYLNALKEKDLSKAPLTADVVFEDPLTPPSNGRELMLEFLSQFLPAFRDVRIIRHVTEGEYVATMWEADTSFGVIPIFECFRVSDGEIKEAKAYFDPRPITNPSQ